MRRIYGSNYTLMVPCSISADCCPINSLTRCNSTPASLSTVISPRINRTRQSSQITAIFYHTIKSSITIIIYHIIIPRCTTSCCTMCLSGVVVTQIAASPPRSLFYYPSLFYLICRINITNNTIASRYILIRLKYLYFRSRFYPSFIINVPPNYDSLSI